MTAVALVRMPFRALEVTENWDKSLLEEAARCIGYRPALLQEAEQTRTRSLDENILARALQTLDIQPFTLQSVGAYKDQMVRKSLQDQSWALTR